MTQAEFNALPMVLKSSDVKVVLGLSDEGLKALRLAQPDLVICLGKREHRWVKEKVAKLAQLRYE